MGVYSAGLPVTDTKPTVRLMVKAEDSKTKQKDSERTADTIGFTDKDQISEDYYLTINAEVSPMGGGYTVAPVQDAVSEELDSTAAGESPLTFGGAEPVQAKPERHPDRVSGLARLFVASYNNLFKAMNDDPETLSHIAASMRSRIYDSVSLNSGEKISLYQIGITTSATPPELVIDEDKLRNVIETRGNDVETLFSKEEEGLGDRFQSIMNTAIASICAKAGNTGIYKALKSQRDQLAGMLKLLRG